MTAQTGVTASWNVASQRLQLTSVANGSPPFLISNVGSPVGAAIIQPGAPTFIAAGATTTSNFLQAFQIPSQVSVTSNLSTQIGDIDAVVNQVLKARTQVGQQIQNLASSTTQLQSLANDNTTTQSTISDTNVAQATSQFTLDPDRPPGGVRDHDPARGQDAHRLPVDRRRSPMVNAPAKSAVITVDLPRFGSCYVHRIGRLRVSLGPARLRRAPRTSWSSRSRPQDQIIWLQCLDDLRIALPLGDPWVFFPGLRPENAGLRPPLARPAGARGLHRSWPSWSGTDGGPTFMNLMAPIVINLKTRIGRQVPLETTKYTVAMEIPIPAAVAEAQARKAAGQAPAAQAGSRFRNKRRSAPPHKPRKARSCWCSAGNSISRS